ncbi:MAG TPA: hypothetical protein VGN00_22515 [Puia sp.]|jgi:hypothetical protein
MSNLKEELSNEIKEIWKIVLLAKDFYNCAFYFQNGSSSDDEKFLRDSRPFQFFAHGFWRLTIIELTKLFSMSESHRFNVPKFVGKLGKDGHFAALNISSELICRWQQSLEDFQPKIESIVVLRNKLYAHTDRMKPDTSQMDLSFQDVKHLLDLGRQIVQDIYQSILGAEASMDSPFLEKTDLNFISILAWEKNDQIQAVLGEKLKWKKGN